MRNRRKMQVLMVTGIITSALCLAGTVSADDAAGEALARAAQTYYENTSGYLPPEADYTENEDGTYTIHLYEIVDNGDGTYHTATSAWYTVDAAGEGMNDITGDLVSLDPAAEGTDTANDVPEQAVDTGDDGSGQILDVPVGIPGQGHDELDLPGLDDVYPENVVALDDLGISVAAEDFISAEEDDGFVYFYTMFDQSIPYVIVGRYDDTTDGFADSFTRYMMDIYDDLDVDEVQEEYDIDGKKFTKVVYGYTVSDYDAVDTRLFCTDENGTTYMFGTKEIPELSYTVPDGLLESLAGSFEGLAGGDGSYVRHVDKNRSISEQEIPENAAQETASYEAAAPRDGQEPEDAKIDAETLDGSIGAQEASDDMQAVG